VCLLWNGWRRRVKQRRVMAIINPAGRRRRRRSFWIQPKVWLESSSSNCNVSSSCPNCNVSSSCPNCNVSSSCPLRVLTVTSPLPLSPAVGPGGPGAQRLPAAVCVREAEGAAGHDGGPELRGPDGDRGHGAGQAAPGVPQRPLNRIRVPFLRFTNTHPQLNSPKWTARAINLPGVWTNPTLPDLHRGFRLI